MVYIINTHLGGDCIACAAWLKPWFLTFQGETAHVASAVVSFPTQFKLEECFNTCYANRGVEEQSEECESQSQLCGVTERGLLHVSRAGTSVDDS